MKLIKLILICFIFSSCFISSKGTAAQKNDYMYSAEYFDYLIECASIADFEMKQKQKQKEKEEAVIPLDNVSLEDTEPIKLKIETSTLGIYKETIKKEDTKAIIPVGDKFNFSYDTYSFKNKYNSNDYRMQTGVEITPTSKFLISSGLETNYRGEDQNPISKKLYISPTFKFNKHFSIAFYNKFDTYSKSQDHDIKLNISPFKSEVMDFSVYAGYTREETGQTSESVLFSTNFYF